MVNVNSDLFTVNYKSSITASAKGQLDLTLIVCPNTKTISGAGDMTFCYHKNIEVGSKIEGSFVTTLMANSQCFLISAMGFQKPGWASSSDTDVPTYPNLLLQLAIDENWKTGVANIKYKKSGANGKIDWIKLDNLSFQATSINKVNSTLNRQNSLSPRAEMRP